MLSLENNSKSLLQSFMDPHDQNSAMQTRASDHRKWANPFNICANVVHSISAQKHNPV